MKEWSTSPYVWIAERRSTPFSPVTSVGAGGRGAATWPTQAREQFAVVEKVAADGNFDDAPRATTILRNVLAPVPAHV